MDHAFKGTRFPWTPERMEFVLNELVVKHKKYRNYSRLVEVYIILAGKIGATPRIVENFVKNLGRDYRELVRSNPYPDPETSRLRGSNRIFKLYEEYSRLYVIQADNDIAGGQITSDIIIDDVVDNDDDDDDDCQIAEIFDTHVKPEPGDSPQIVSVISINSATSDCTCEDPPSPTPPPTTTLTEATQATRSPFYSGPCLKSTTHKLSRAKTAKACSAKGYLTNVITGAYSTCVPHQCTCLGDKRRDDALLSHCQ